jgi:hypothetical protein
MRIDHRDSRRFRNRKYSPVEVERLVVAVSYALADPSRTVIRVVGARPKFASRFRQRSEVVVNGSDLWPGPILEMLQDKWRYPDVVVNNISLRKPGLRIKNLAQSRAFDVLPFNFERDLIAIGR